MELVSKDDLTLDIIESGCVTWYDLVRSVRNFKYGRGADRGDFKGVWNQRMGTCSTKHGFLHMIAERNGFHSVQLLVGIYLLTSENTPKAASVLHQFNLTGIPEAHCYLKVEDEYLDVTTNQSDFKNIAADVLEEKFVDRSFLIADKITYHRHFMQSWCKKNISNYSFDELWDIREKVITALSD